MEKAFKQNMERSKALLGGQKVNVSDLKMAELSIIQYVQASHYSEEISSVHTNIKKSSTLYRLDPVLKYGILRVGGRLSKAALPEEVKFLLYFPNILMCRHSSLDTYMKRWDI